MKSKYVVLILVLLVTLFMMLSLESAYAGAPASLLQQIQQAVKPAYAGLVPAPSVERERGEAGGILVIRYEVRKYLVYGHYRTGDWSTNAVEEIGPTATGFILTINLEKLGEPEQLVTPQTIQEPYWQTFIDLTPIAGTTNQIVWTVSYGARTDQRLVERIKRAIRNWAGKETRQAESHAERLQTVVEQDRT